MVYRDIDSALEAACSSTMAHLEMNVLLFDDPRYTVRLALHKFFFRRRVHPKPFAQMEGLAVLPWLAVPCPSIVSRYPNAEELLEE